MQVTVRLEDDIAYSIGRLATFGGQTYEALVNQALREYLAANPPKPMPVRKAAPPPMP
jgi:predicted transcriptional regulator